MNYPMMPQTELEGRMLINAFGVPEKATLPKFAWRYYDWCVDQGFDAEAWIKHVDEKRPPQLSFSECILGCLWQDECDRHKNGDTVPPWKAPEGYQE